MTTANQLVRKGRKKPRKRRTAPALRGCPQRRGVVTRVTVVKPKKPNSANRPMCRVKLTSGVEISAYIPGEKTARHIAEHTPVLVRGGGPKDVPGVKYTVIPGGQKLIPGSGATPEKDYPRRNKRRSVYGVGRP